MTTDQFIGAPPAPNLFARLRELWLSADDRRRRCGDLESTRAALGHLDDHMRRDIGLDAKEQPLLSRADIILQMLR